MTLANDIARDLLKIKAVYLKPEEPFTWASGIKSPIYTDNRVTLARNSDLDRKWLCRKNSC